MLSACCPKTSWPSTICTLIVVLGFRMGVPAVLEQKTTICHKYLYLLVSLKDSSGLCGAYEAIRRGVEENPVHRRNAPVNVDKIRGFRPPYVWRKTFGYCWSSYLRRDS